jgi:lipopolysaccharide/colanic/teichoic acid biosynthesis glycosyltransferase
MVSDFLILIYAISVNQTAVKTFEGRKMIKRLLDIVIASIALVILSPLYIFVAYKVKKI